MTSRKPCFDYPHELGFARFGLAELPAVRSPLRPSQMLRPCVLAWLIGKVGNTKRAHDPVSGHQARVHAEIDEYPESGESVKWIRNWSARKHSTFDSPNNALAVRARSWILNSYKRRSFHGCEAPALYTPQKSSFLTRKFVWLSVEDMPVHKGCHKSRCRLGSRADVQD